MDSRKVAGLLLAAMFLTGSAAALSIDIDLFDFGGGEGEDTNQSSNSSTESEDDGFSYGGEESDQITDDEVEKGLLEMIVSAIVNFLFG